MLSHVIIPAIVGATASGKSSLARGLADHTGGRIISLDSRKIYRRLDIGTAKPTPELLAQYDYAMVNIIEPIERYSAFQYAETATHIIEDTLRAGRLPIIAGGTGLYLRALKGGLFQGPGADKEVRKYINDLGERDGWEAVFNQLEQVDPAAAKRIGPANRQRIIRALEVFYVTGKPMTSVQQTGAYHLPEWQFAVFGIDRPRKELHDRIAQRTELMIERGLLEEVKQLVEEGIPGSAPGFKSVGYREALDYLAGEIPEDQVTEKIMSSTRQYAKRQMTWFRNQEEIKWVAPDESNIETILQQIRSN